MLPVLARTRLAQRQVVPAQRPVFAGDRQAPHERVTALNLPEPAEGLRERQGGGPVLWRTARAVLGIQPAAPDVILLQVVAVPPPAGTGSAAGPGSPSRHWRRSCRSACRFGRAGRNPEGRTACRSPGNVRLSESGSGASPDTEVGTVGPVRPGKAARRRLAGGWRLKAGGLRLACRNARRPSFRRIAATRFSSQYCQPAAVARIFRFDAGVIGSIACQDSTSESPASDITASATF